MPTLTQSSTEDILKEMLTENTGQHLLDSGGAYGRNYERNQGRDFDAEPALSVEWHNRGGRLEILVERSVFHYLRENVEYDPDLDVAFEEFLNLEERQHTYYLQDMEDWIKQREDEGHEIDGSFGTFNTYNGECLLSQTLQGMFYVEDGTSYVLLQIHGGCDVRGGYTRPRAFRADPYEFFCYNDALVRPEPPPPPPQDPLTGEWPERDWTAEPYWSTDDGYHWYFQGACGYGAGAQLETYDATDNPEELGQGKVYVDEDGQAFCPITGRRLVAC
jgi:hypothetical protein